VKHSLLGALVVLGLAAPVMAQTPAAPNIPVQSAAASKYIAPRTADGQPSLEGYWNSATYTPFERPANLKDKAFFTPEEAVAFEKQRQQAFESQAPDDIHYDNAIWQSERTTRGLQSLRTSLVIDPPDGRVPAQTDEAVKRNAAAQAARRALGGAYDKVQNRPLAERCTYLNATVPRVLRKLVPFGQITCPRSHRGDRVRGMQASQDTWHVPKGIGLNSAPA